MSLKIPDTDIKLSKGLIDLQMGVTEGRSRTMSSSSSSIERKNLRSISQGNSRKYFSIESLLVLVCLTASLLILPLILPPLPPPPFMFLLLPICILALLMILALIPENVRDIASSYV